MNELAKMSLAPPGINRGKGTLVKKSLGQEKLSKILFQLNKVFYSQARMDLAVVFSEIRRQIWWREEKIFPL